MVLAFFGERGKFKLSFVIKIVFYIANNKARIRAIKREHKRVLTLLTVIKPRQVKCVIK